MRVLNLTYVATISALNVDLLAFKSLEIMACRATLIMMFQENQHELQSLDIRTTWLVRCSDGPENIMTFQEQTVQQTIQTALIEHGYYGHFTELRITLLWHCQVHEVKKRFKIKRHLPQCNLKTDSTDFLFQVFSVDSG